MTTMHTDPNVCYRCERLLAPYEEVYCGPCAEKVLDDWPEPSDDQLLRRQETSLRFWLGDWAAVGLAVWVGIILTTLFISREMH